MKIWEKGVSMLIDFHTHLDFYRQSELNMQLEAFSGMIIAASVDEKSYLANLKIAGFSKKQALSCNSLKIIPTFGIHPERADENACLLENRETASRFEKYLEASPLTGEIGMDFCWAKTSRENQEKVFRFCLEHSNRRGKACVVHTKGAEKEIAGILSDYPDAKIVIHWYDGPEDIYRDFLRRGYMQTFGVETIRSPHIQKLLKLTPPELMLAETDNPDSEIWLGGKRSDLFLIDRVYSDLSLLLKIPREKLENIIEENTRRLFSF